MDDITINDIPENCREIAQVVGMDVFLELVELCGGERIYIPVMKTLKASVRNRKIKENFQGNVKDVMREYKISETQVRNILEGKGGSL